MPRNWEVAMRPNLVCMVMGIVFPRPLLLVLAMSLGQLFGTLSLALYLLAIVLDLQGVGEHDDIRPHIGIEGEGGTQTKE